MPDRMSPSPHAGGTSNAVCGLEIRLFGPMDVRIGPRPLPRLRSRKGMWLLALLALRAGRPLDRDWLAGTLWLDDDTDHARRSLRQSLYDLRLALGAEAWRLTDCARRTLRPDMDGAFVDVQAFDAAMARGDDDSLETAVSLYRGPLLEGCVEEWCLEERRRCEEAYLSALQRLAAAAAARPDPAAAASYLRRAVGADPYREELQRALMEALASSGNPAEALAVYGQFSALLAREMAAEPEEETTALFRRLCSGRQPPAPPTPEALAGAPAPAPAPRPRSHLPRPLSQFVGRERELRAIGACLAGARLVTLTGTGGIGKTRLAIRAAEEQEKEQQEDAWFVDLAALTDPGLVPQAVARALRVHGAPGAAPTETLVQALDDRRLLLVLDNCEHLVDACAHLVEALLSGCPHLHILATSRQPLGLTGETVWPVPPLSVPGVQAFGYSGIHRECSLPPPSGQRGKRREERGQDGQDRSSPIRDQYPAHPANPVDPVNAGIPERLMEYEAIRLFVERAAPAGFALTESNAAVTAQLCRWLDSIPLAIELAAARLRVLSLDQIASRLDDRFQLLTGGSRTALPRQQTLRATLDWSYHLLAEPERTLLRRLAVFAGGFTLEAAEAVCACVLDLLTQLVDRSLVGVERREGAVRYVLLETTREYARDRLREAGEEEDLQARHARFFLALAEQAEPELRGAAQAEWLHRLDEEHDNFRAALDWCLQAVDSGWWLVDSSAESGAKLDLSLSVPTTNHQPLPTASEIGLRIAAGLGWFWWMRGYLLEGRARLEAFLRRSAGERASPEVGGPHGTTGGVENSGGPAQSTPARRLAQVKALNAAGMIADEQGDTAAARVFFEESLALSRALSYRLGAAQALSNLGGLAMQARDYPAARALYEARLTISEEIGDPWSTAGALTNLGRLANVAGDPVTARALVERALAVQRQLQDRRAIARSLTVLGIAADRLGEYEAAQALYLESLSIARELGATAGVIEALRALGDIARERGDAAAVAAFYEDRLALAREVGCAWAVAESLAALGLVARRRGERPRAGALWSESLLLFQRQGNPRGVAECLEGLASLAALPGPEERGQERPPSLRGVPDARGGRREVEHGGDHARQAARLLGAAEAMREAVGAAIDPRRQVEYGQQLALVRDRLPAAAFATAWAEGRAMAAERAVALALAIGSGSNSPAGS